MNILKEFVEDVMKGLTIVVNERTNFHKTHYAMVSIMKNVMAKMNMIYYS